MVTPITLPVDESQTYPLVRILAQRRYSQKGTWEELPMIQRSDLGRARSGFHLLSCSRACLPAIGEAVFRFQYGVIDGASITASPETSGDPSDLSVDTEAPNLAGYEIRIQMAPAPTLEQFASFEDFDVNGAGAVVFNAAWVTVWWGTVEYQTDHMSPGANFAHGQRLYHCVDALARTRNWRMNRHGYKTTAGECQHVEGHPGYNHLDVDGRVAGNRQGTSYSYPGEAASMGITVDFHTVPGATGAAAWTDLQAVTHALASSRGLLDPVFTVSGLTTLLSTSTGSWPIDPDSDNVFDFLCRVCDRRRGRGDAFLDWTEASATGELTPLLRVRPQTYADVVVPTVATISGANTHGTAVDVVLVGDHRNIASNFTLGTRSQNKVDYLETLGERIEVLVTVSTHGTDLAERWAAAEETNFLAEDPQTRRDPRWEPVFQRYGLSNDPLTLCDDGNQGARARYDYRCADDGTITQPENGDERDTSPLMVEVLRDIPLYEGYNYTTNATTRWDAAAELSEPSRRPPMAVLRTAANRYVDCQALGFAVAIQRRDLLIYNPDDRQTGRRTIGITTETDLGSAFNTDQLAVSIAVRLPHRVRLASGDPDGRRKMRLFHPDHHLWLADASALWGLDGPNTDDDGMPGLRAAAAGTGDPGILRDDRSALRLYHALAVEWYMTERRPVSYSLRCCGLLPGFDVVDPDDSEARITKTYPTLGQVIDTLSAGGVDYTIRTPVTSIQYDHIAGVTHWQTDWQDLDFDIVPRPTRGLDGAV